MMSSGYSQMAQKLMSIHMYNYIRTHMYLHICVHMCEYICTLIFIHLSTYLKRENDKANRIK